MAFRMIPVVNTQVEVDSDTGDIRITFIRERQEETMTARFKDQVRELSEVRVSLKKSARNFVDDMVRKLKRPEFEPTIGQADTLNQIYLENEDLVIGDFR